MSTFGAWTVIAARTACIRQKALPVLLLLKPLALHFWLFICLESIKQEDARVPPFLQQGIVCKAESTATT